MPRRLNATVVKQAKPRKNRYIITDNLTPGFALVTNPNGSKYFYYRYRPPGSNTVIEESIGNASTLSVSDARKAAMIKAGEAAKGIDLKAERRARLQLARNATEQKDLQLFNYIDNYYAPYARKHSVIGEEIVKCLKREFGFLKDRPITKIHGSDIDHWRGQRCDAITYSRIKLLYTYLKACLNTAVKHYRMIDRYELQNYVLKRRITERVNPPKVRYLLKEEEERLIKALAARDQSLREQRARYVKWQSQRNHSKRQQECFAPSDYPDHVTPIIVIAYQTGFDIGDIFDLHWEHVDFANNQIRKIRNKTRHKQDNPQPVVVPMSPKVQDILTQWGKQHGMKGRVFKSPRTGGRLDNINKAWRAVLKEAKIDNLRLKDLRHTFGSWLAIDGADLLEIRDLMGHRDVKTTQVYAHLCPQQKRDAIMRSFSA